jgi:two-component system chemotaxis response regulator CheB
LFDKAGYDVGFAKNGLEAVEFVKEYDFDVITMDINMPVMDGLTAIKEIMHIKPTPIVVISSLTQDEAEITFEALDLGAVDYVAKPGTITLDLKRQEQEILSKIAMAMTVPKSKLHIKKMAHKKAKSLLESKKELPKKVEKLVLIGASTGGPGLIETILSTVPGDYPYPICVVQHMPESFTSVFAHRLNKISDLDVIEAKSGEILKPGMAVIAKGGKHLHFAKKTTGDLYIKLVPNTMNHFFCPAVDEMFFSAARVFNAKNILAIELTGIGDDGADGMVELRKKGAYTIAESPETAVVYGMPKMAYERGGAVKQLPFPKIVDEILKYGSK